MARGELSCKDGHVVSFWTSRHLLPPSSTSSSSSSSSPPHLLFRCSPNAPRNPRCTSWLRLLRSRLALPPFFSSNALALGSTRNKRHLHDSSGSSPQLKSMRRMARASSRGFPEGRSKRSYV